MATNRVSRSRHIYLISTLLLVLSTVSILQASASSPLEPGSGDSNTGNCMGLCGEGYECIEGSCSKTSCIKDCSNEPYAPLCATEINTIAETFNNECELDNRKCENKDDQWLRIYDEPCVTTPPPKNLCQEHQMQYFNTPNAIYSQMCNLDNLRGKEISGTLQLEDFLPCYYPTCVDAEYTAYQCSSLLGGWCWCSDRTGLGNRDTLQYGLLEKDCDLEACYDEDGKHDHQSLFTPASGCGLCECLNGEITCYENYVPSSMGMINESQMNLLKDELIQLYSVHYTENQHQDIDIRHIYQHPTAITEEKKRAALEWKFEYYDRDGNAELSSGERHIIKAEIQDFFYCTSFFDQFIERINKNFYTENINLSQWGEFFGITFSENSGSTSTGLELAKRHAHNPQQLRINRLERKKRFLYTLE